MWLQVEGVDADVQSILRGYARTSSQQASADADLSLARRLERASSRDREKGERTGDPHP